MSPPQLTQLLNIDIWALVRIFVLILLLMYTIFALVIVRQVGLMTRALELKLEPLIKFISWVHLALAIFVFFITWILL